MNCRNFYVPPCGPDQHKPNIETASIVVGIDLNQSINLSEMTVKQASVEPIQQLDGRMIFERKSELTTRVVSDDGESEDELEIVIIRKSQKRPLF